MQFSELPDLVHDKIFSFLPLSQLHVCGLVSELWEALAAREFDRRLSGLSPRVLFFCEHYPDAKSIDGRHFNVWGKRKLNWRLKRGRERRLDDPPPPTGVRIDLVEDSDAFDENAVIRRNEPVRYTTDTHLELWACLTPFLLQSHPQKYALVEVNYCARTATDANRVNNLLRTRTGFADAPAHRMLSPTYRYWTNLYSSFVARCTPKNKHFIVRMELAKNIEISDMTITVSDMPLKITETRMQFVLMPFVDYLPSCTFQYSDSDVIIMHECINLEEIKMEIYNRGL